MKQLPGILLLIWFTGTFMVSCVFDDEKTPVVEASHQEDCDDANHDEDTTHVDDHDDDSTHVEENHADTAHVEDHDDCPDEDHEAH